MRPGLNGIIGTHPAAVQPAERYHAFDSLDALRAMALPPGFLRYAGRRRARIFPVLQAATATPKPASASTAK